MILFVKGTRAYALFTAADRWLAGAIGMRFGDRYTISAQCYRSSCRICALLRRLLDVIQRDHCRIACELEGLEE